MSEAGTKNAMVIAAEAGDDKAQCELAMSYEHGIGCPKDYNIAAKWYEAAATQGNGFAAYKLALMHENGLLGGPNVKEAMVWLERAAQCGLSEAQYKLGVMLDAGKSGMENPKEASGWFQLAADQGVADAQWRLGVLYENGRGVKQDFEKAAKLYAAASAQGNLNAHYCLGVMHVTGDGVQQNPGEALRLFTMAAEAGHAQAKRRLTAANIGKPGAFAEEPEPELLTRNKKTTEEAPPVLEPMREFWMTSLKQASVLSLGFVVLVLTPVGDLLNSLFKIIGWPLAILGVVGGGVALLAMAMFFKKRKEHVEDRWFKIACVVMVIAGIAIVIGVLGFSKFQFDNPDDHKDVVTPGGTNAEQLLERAKQAGQKQ